MRNRILLTVTAVIAVLLLLGGWLLIATTMPGLHIRTVGPNGDVIKCQTNGTCVYENTIDISYVFGPLQDAFFVGAITAGIGVALVTASLYTVRSREEPTTKEQKDEKKGKPSMG